MGAWADVFGKKAILYLWCICAVLGQVGIMLTAIFFQWRKEIYLVAELPKAIIGNLSFDLDKLSIIHRLDS